MKFAQTGWLWALLLLPMVYLFFRADVESRKKRLERFASPALWGSIAPEIDWNARLRRARHWLTAVGFVFIALARPQWGTHEEVLRTNGMDVFIALDVSNSMEVEDVAPSRLAKARHMIRTLLERLGGDRVGLVTFASSAGVACPLTTDLEYLFETVTLASPRAIKSQGTDISAALETARRALDRGAESPDTPASSAIVLISDGEDHEGEAIAMAEKLRTAGVKLYALGVGTQKGGPIPMRDENGNLHGYKKDRKGQPIVSTFKPDFLLQLAAAGGGRYWNASADEGEIEELVQDLKGLGGTEQSERRFVVHEDRYQYPLAIALLFFFLELGTSLRRATGTAVLALLLLGAPRQAQAEGIGAYLENEKGLKAFQDKKTEEAKQHFGAAQALEPSSPSLEFNQGVVQAQEGLADQAIETFNRAAQNALKQKKPDHDLAGRSHFNKGAALSGKGDVEGAIHAYVDSIVEARHAKDSALEADARKNIELLMQKREQQKQQQSQQGEKGEQKDQKQQSQNQKDQQNNSSDKQDEKKDQQADQKKEQDKKYQETTPEQRKRQFRSVKLSPEDAERVMSELKNRERDLQGKIKKQHGTAQNSSKDW